MDKPEGITSFAVVRRVRRRFGGVRAGHVGSLDPFATGLLPVCLGRATRLARFVTAGAKRYRATVRFGQATDTDDRTGQALGPTGHLPGEAEVRDALPGFLGETLQRPPAYSAKRIQGRRAYRLARAGTPPDLDPVVVRVDRLELVAFDGRDAGLECEVGPGAYIRALARDLGERLGTAAHLQALRREVVGPFSLDGAVSLEALEALPDIGAAREFVLPPLAALAGMPRLEVGDDAARALGHGRTVPLEAVCGAAADPAGDPELRAAVRRVRPRLARDEDLELVAVVRFAEVGWRPVLVWAAEA